MIILYILIGFLVGGSLCYFILRPKLRKIECLNEEIALQNSKMLEENEQISLKNIALNEETQKLLHKKDILLAQKEELLNSVRDAEQAAETIYEKTMETMQERLSNSAENLGKNYQYIKLGYEQDYLFLMENLNSDFQEIMKSKQLTLQKLNDEIDDLSKKINAAVEANKRAQEIKDKENFYKITLSDIDLNEIKCLREVASLLRNQEPLNKIIWKVYYEKAYTDLIGRVVGNKVRTGIYKITNLENQMCYVGQAVDIASRWKQHIKRGIGAETPTKNKLYPAMQKYGVENFTFEIIEDCPKEKLNEREKYWQNYFKAKEFGYSIK